MNLDTIEVDRDLAKAKLDEYRKSLATDRNVEDEAIAAAYRMAAQGYPIISLSTAIAAGGWFDNGLPRLAVARADAKSCTVQRESWRSARRLTFFDEFESGRPVRALVGENHVGLDLDLPEAVPGVRLAYRGTTVVPPVPPQFRPKAGTPDNAKARLRRLHILWEVEKWDPTPPRDPALLRHIRGDLWAVLAVWDLTDIERHVLAQRMHTTS